MSGKFVKGAWIIDTIPEAPTYDCKIEIRNVKNDISILNNKINDILHSSQPSSEPCLHYVPIPYDTMGFFKDVGLLFCIFMLIAFIIFRIV